MVAAEFYDELGQRLADWLRKTDCAKKSLRQEDLIQFFVDDLIEPFLDHLERVGVRMEEG